VLGVTQLNALEADLLVAIHTEIFFVNLRMLVAFDFDLLAKEWSRLP
jgi:hypothetical protein